MRKYVLRRVLLIIPTVYIVTLLIFLLVRLMPGNVVYAIYQDAGLSLADINLEKARLGLDKPVYQQYFVWMGNIIRGELGRSLFSKDPVLEELRRKLPVTLELAVLAIFFSVVIGIPFGVISAIRQDSFLDYGVRILSISWLAIPGFWIATISILALSLFLRWIPPLMYTNLFEDPLTNLKQLLLPSFILGFNNAASLMRMSRTTTLEVLRQDYIRTARAKGLVERVIIFRHALKNSLIPVVTILGLEIAGVAGGSVIMESIFGLPGVGRYLFQAISVRDYPVIQAVNLMLAAFIMFVNLGADLSLGVLDPRIRYE